MLHLMERQGRERGAVLASHGSDGYYKAPRWSKTLGRMRGVLEYPKAEGQPRFPRFPPHLPLGTLLRCQTGGTGGTGAEVGVVCCALGGLQRELSSPGMQELRRSPPVCHDPAVAPPDREASALTPSCPELFGPAGVLRVLGVVL